MDLEHRIYQYLDGPADLPRLTAAVAKIQECGGHGYEVEFTCGENGRETTLFPTLPAARAAVEQAVARTEREIERAARRVRHRIRTRPWWRTPIQIEELNRILELANLQAEGVVLVDPWGRFAWAPPGTWLPGQHLRLEIPPNGHCLASAAFALLEALDEAFARTGRQATASPCGMSLPPFLLIGVLPHEPSFTPLVVT